MSVAIIILAAGNSSRMGTPKQLLSLGDHTLLGTVIDNAQQSQADEVFCVLGANAKEVSLSITTYGVEILVNSSFHDGLSSSIIAGINHIKDRDFDAVLIMLGDQPLIDSYYLNSIVNTFKNRSDKIIATNYNGTLGVPVVIPKSYYSLLLQLKGDKGAKEFLNSRHEQVISLNNDSLFDIDTQEDYKALIKKLKQTN